MPTRTQPWRPLPLRALLDEAIRHGRRHFRATYPGAAIPLALAAAVFALVQASFAGLFGGRMPDEPGYMLLGMGLLLIAAVLYGIAYGLGCAALSAAAVEAVAGRPVSMRSAWRAMLNPRAIGTVTLTWLAFCLGLIFCILPGLYVGILFGLTVPVMVEERLFGVLALGRSSELLRHNPRRDVGDDPRLKLFVVSLVGWLLGYAVSFVVQMPLVVTQQVLMFRGITAGDRPDPAALTAQMYWLQVPTTMLGTLAQVATQLYVSFGVALLFFDIKGRKEGADLEVALDELARRSAPTTVGEMQ